MSASSTSSTSTSDGLKPLPDGTGPPSVVRIWAGDTTHVPLSDPYRAMRTETLLRRVALARARGDWRSARAEWEACVARARVRVASVVDRHYEGDDDHEDVVQEALVRGGRSLVENLDDLGEPAFFAAMVQCAKYQCLDSNRSYRARKRHEAGSLDAGGRSDDETAAGRQDRLTAGEALERARRDEEARDASRRIDEALPRLRDPRARRIITYDRLGSLPDSQLAEAIGTSVANVQQIRSRALKELRGLIEA